MTEKNVRAGDTILMEQGNVYVAATDADVNGYFYVCGWPPGECHLRDVEDVTESASDEERESMLRKIASSKNGGGGRAARAKAQLMVIDDARRLEEAKESGSADIRDHMESVGKWGEEKGWDRTDVQIPSRGSLQPAHVIKDVPLIDADGNVFIEGVITKLGLVDTEIAEAIEEVRDGNFGIRFEGEKRKPEGMVVELADAYIRIVHLAYMLGLDLPAAIEAKLAYNQGRPFRHGGRKA